MKASEEALSVEQLSYDELKYIQQQAKKVELSAEALQFLIELRKWCAENQIQVSDRRWRKIVGMLQVSAYTNGQSQITIWDCWLVQHCIWEKPEQIELVAGMYEQYCGKSVVNLQNLLMVVDVLEKEAEQLPKSSQQIKNDINFATPSENTTHIIKSELIEINTPIFPEAVADGTIATWHVEVGDKVVKDQVICDIETDKVVLEVLAPNEGVLYAVIKDEGETVLSKENIALLELKKEPIRNTVDQNSSTKTIADLIKTQFSW